MGPARYTSCAMLLTCSSSHCRCCTICGAAEWSLVIVRSDSVESATSCSCSLTTMATPEAALKLEIARLTGIFQFFSPMLTFFLSSSSRCYQSSSIWRRPLTASALEDPHNIRQPFVQAPVIENTRSTRIPSLQRKPGPKFTSIYYSTSSIRPWPVALAAPRCNH